MPRGLKVSKRADERESADWETLNLITAESLAALKKSISAAAIRMVEFATATTTTDYEGVVPAWKEFSPSSWKFEMKPVKPNFDKIDFTEMDLEYALNELMIRLVEMEDIARDSITSIIIHPKKDGSVVEVSIFLSDE